MYEHHSPESVFTYRAHKNGVVHICWHGKQVLILKNQAAEKFLARITGLDQDAAQLFMAKITGKFKHGTER